MTTLNKPSKLSYFPKIVLSVFFIAIIFGLLGTWLPAFGYLPVIGQHSFSLNPWQELIAHPSLSKSLTATLISGWGAALGSLSVALAIVVLSYGSQPWRYLERALAPILSIPHAAFAIGFGFLISPSGWLIRLISPGLTGFDESPDWSILQDPHGLSLMVALIIKETPFLLLIIIGALNRLRLPENLAIGRSLGYQPVQVWIKLIIPQLYPHIRLSVFAIIAYSLSVVDISMILGPTAPPTLPVLILQWFNDPDISLRLIGAAGATLLLLLVAFSIGLAWILEMAIRLKHANWVVNGKRTTIVTFFKPLSFGTIGILVFFTLISVLVLFIWSFTWRWQFPQALPSEWSVRFWSKGFNQAGGPIWITFITGLASAFIALVLVIGCLEYEVVLQKKGRKINYEKLLWFAYLPLLIPQIAFIFGVQMVLTAFLMDGYWLSLVGSHLIFVYPYIFLTLSTTYRNFDQRISQLASILSGSKWKAFIQIKLPMLLRPILFSFAIGFSVSVAQYIPTLFIGAGRFTTITTEAVNLASGSDRRIVAVYALCQQLVPLVIFVLAIFIPKALFTNRRDMQV